jgi:uncharacterized protein (DUF305 family)
MAARLRVVAMLAAAAITLSGCGGASLAGSADGEHNAADVAFAQEMIPHHAQAVMMAEMVQRRGASVHLEDLAERIESAQEDEIDLMVGWLDDWGEDAAWSGHRGAMHGYGMYGGRRGDHWGPMMMTGPRAFGTMMHLRQGGFEQRWLTMMIAHHRVALRMTAQEQAEGQSPDRVSLAGRMESVQRAEIAEMQAMLRR